MPHDKLLLGIFRHPGNFWTNLKSTKEDDYHAGKEAASEERQIFSEALVRG